MVTRNPASPDASKAQSTPVHTGTTPPTRAHSAAFVAAARRHATRRDDANAFVTDPSEHTRKHRDDLAEELGEEFIASATSGEPVGQEARDIAVPEDSGGPFVVSNAKTEFGRGVDASNPEDADVEPFPTATATTRR